MVAGLIDARQRLIFAAITPAAPREDAANLLLELLGDHGSLVVTKPKRAIRLTFEERNAAIRAYTSTARDTLERGAMIDAVIEAINTERTS